MINVVENILNIVLALALVGRCGVLGLALAFALAYLITAVWAIRCCRTRCPGSPCARCSPAIWRMVLAGVLGGEVAGSSPT